MFRRNILYYYFSYFGEISQNQENVVSDSLLLWMMIATPPISQKWKKEKPWIIRHIFFSFSRSSFVLTRLSESFTPTTQNKSSVIPPSLVIFNFNLCIILAKFRTRILGYISQISLVDDDRQSTYFTKIEKKKATLDQSPHLLFLFWSSLLLTRLS